MDDRQEPVTRLGPDSGGRGPGEPGVRYYTWEWGPDDARRPGLPWIGIFLLVFGGLLLIQQLFPQFEALGSVVVLAVGLAFLVKWAIDRGTGSLYAGAIITALAVPGLLNAAGIEANGLSTFSLGIAFLFIAGGACRDRRRVRLAALVRWPAGADRRREHRQCVARRADPAGDPRRARSRPDPARCHRPADLTVSGPARGQSRPATCGDAAVAASIDAASVVAIRSSSASVTTNGGPSRIVSPSTPLALPVPE